MGELRVLFYIVVGIFKLIAWIITAIFKLIGPLLPKRYKRFGNANKTLTIYLHSGPYIQHCRARSRR